ncbi:hypothetical protein [Thioalkalivibrio paradoxus]|uniref:Uncharacterized protein n=1 Tax=Thioalkalivibrio paradoxus ARh 1 TaxID=713585 RepID=W0DNB0_9GAMM|nr:hypothetical protein [Thioalkalivibrio paradoxus]AHE98478.1 hypothetical protein THITH_09605 [Thioalkalivibrio paradoxus ARh 1]
MDFLPYEFTTPGGDAISFEFRLHPETGSATRVHQLLDRILHTLNHEIALLGETRNGDLLQALAMAMAVRTEMIPADPELTRRLALEVMEQALRSLQHARHQEMPVGHA